MNLDRNGILGSLLYLIIIVCCLLLLGFSTPLPLPAERGILISFGTSETGSGNIQPEIKKENAQAAAPKQQASTTQAQGEETFLTQDMEEAPALPSTKKETKKTNPTPQKTTETVKTPHKTTENTSKKEEPKTPKINPNALYKGSKNSPSTSEGETGGKGDQGKTDGSYLSTSHSLGYGSGDGISFSLEGRSFVALPTPAYKHQTQGKVVVEITVDKSGTVVNAVPGVRGSTTLDTYLLEAAKKAALRSRFNTILDGPAFQKGSITYVFKLQ
jgi:TonB family protein